MERKIVAKIETDKAGTRCAHGCIMLIRNCYSGPYCAAFGRLIGHDLGGCVRSPKCITAEKAAMEGESK